MLFSASNPKGDDDQDWYSITMADPTWWCGSMLGPVSGHSSLSAVNCPIMKIMVIIITATTSAVIMMMKLTSRQGTSSQYQKSHLDLSF